MDNSSDFFGEPSPYSRTSSPARELVSDSEAGGYSQIWRFDRGGRFRVLKCLREDFRGNPLYERLLLKEFEIGYSLSHENICEYYSFTSDPELGACIEMEWIDGRTLEEFLSEGKKDHGVCDKVAGEICSALSYMHAKQVLHRDLKPSNIIVTFNGDNVRLIDFGLSDADSSSILKTPAGTAVYAAPEVRSGGKASVRSDLYSLGMVMSLFPVRRYSHIVRKLCSPRPENRYSSVQDVRKALNSNMSLWAGIVFILFIAAMALAPVFEKRLHQAPVPESLAPVPDSLVAVPEPVEGQTDTTVILKEVKNPKARKPSSPAPKTPADAHLIDELFRQATELFE